MKKSFSFNLVAISAVAVSWIMAIQVEAQEEKQLREPVFRQPKVPTQPQEKQVQQDAVESNEEVNQAPAERIARADSPVTSTNSSVETKAHPLDDAIELAQNGLSDIRNNLFDYTALMVKRERVNGKLGDVEYMRVKVRNERQTNDGVVPFGIYMKFVKPKAVKDREVIWVKGENDGNLMVHEGKGVGALKTFHLDPTGWLAMQGNRYPICEAGLENLTVRLIEKASRDRNAGNCVVNYVEGVKINKRPCKLIEVIHEDQRAPYDFHKAQVFIDNELNLPVRYAAYDWPEEAGGKPVLMEEYTYVDIKVNVGLTSEDFNPRNPDYSFPNR